MENEDFVKELGYLGFTMRLKRISDAMMHEGRRLYSELDVDIEPNWYVVFKLLKKHDRLGVTEIAEKLQMSHPSVITITNKMMKAGYLESERDKEDTRKRVLELSARALKKLPEFEAIWDAGTAGMVKALEGLDALNFIEAVEQRFLHHKGFKDRTLEQLK